MTPLASRSVSGQLKVLGLALVLLIPIVAAASLWNLTSQSRDIRTLTTSYTPALDANNAVLIDMTEANVGWSQLIGGSAPATSYLAKQGRVSVELATIERALASPSLPVKDRTRYAALLAQQRAAVDAWFRSARAAEDAMTGTPAERSGLEAGAIDRFGQLRYSNRGLYDVLKVERDAARDGARRSVQLLVATAAVTVLLAMAIVLRGWRLLERSVSGPLERLRSVVERQRDGDRDALADTDTGAAEIRGLAAGFNGLTRSNQLAPGAAGGRPARSPARTRRRAGGPRSTRHRHRPEHGVRRCSAKAWRSTGSCSTPTTSPGPSTNAPSGTATTCPTSRPCPPPWRTR